MLASQWKDLLFPCPLVEGSKGEAEAGQEELNIKYSDALSTADHHTLAKHGIKEIAHQQGYAAKGGKVKVQTGGSSFVGQAGLGLDKKNYKFKKIGHAGTLDPFATGVLGIAIGEATKSIDYLNDKKEYEFNITFGESKTTEDLEVLLKNEI